MSSKNPAVQSRNQYQRNWGNYANVGVLPNTPGFVAPVNLLQPLEVGDLAYVNNVGLVQCDAPGVPGDGLAQWSTVGGGGASSDHFAPRWIVGNVLAGDPAVAQLAPFRYIPDPGDGSGIALALAEALVAARGDVFIRSGIYTLPSGTPTLQIPSGVTVRGAGWETEIIGADDQRAVVRVGEMSTIENIKITMPAPVPGATGDLVIELAGYTIGNSTARNVYVDAAQRTLDDSLIGGIGSLVGPQQAGALNTRTLDCVVVGSVYSVFDPQAPRQFACFSFPDADQAVIRGLALFGDYALRLTGNASRCIVDLQSESYRTAQISGLGHQCRITGVTFFTSFDGITNPWAVECIRLLRSELHLDLVGFQSDVTCTALVMDKGCIGNRVDLTTETYGTGATVSGARNVLSGIEVEAGMIGAVVGIDFTAASVSNVLIGGVLNATTPIVDSGTTNEIAHTVT